MRPSSPDSSGSGRRVLIVMRHAKAEPYATEDHRRELTDRGRRDAAAAGVWLAAEGVVPTHAFVSSAARTRGTWEAVAHGSRSAAEVLLEDALYTAGPDSVLDTLREAPADAEVVIYIGHNPTAAYLAHLLDSGEPDPEAFRAMSEGYPTAAMAVLEVGVAWADLDSAGARLTAFHVGHG